MRVVLTLLVCGFSLSVFADHWIPPPAALSADKLPEGALLRLKLNKDLVVAGAVDGIELGRVGMDGNELSCYAIVPPVNWERKIPSAAKFNVTSTSLMLSAMTVGFQVSSSDADFVSKIVCGIYPVSSPYPLRAATLEQMSCLLDIWIWAPENATNPPLVCPS
jgi:hypothetical protein